MTLCSKLALLAFPLTLTAQSSLTLQPSRISDSTLVEVLNWGARQDLNKLTGGNHTDLALHLYAVGHSGSCVAETEWVCSYRYVLAVSEHGEAPAQAAFDLGELGEIANIKWLKANDSFHAVLEVDVRNYPLHAVKRNPSLKLQSHRYRLELSGSSLKATLVS